MARLVKCYDTNEQVEKSAAFAESISGNRKRYWSSEEACNKWHSNNENREECIRTIMELLNYSEGMKLPTIAYKKLKEFNIYGYDTLLETINQQRDNINWCINNKNFSSETGMVMYVFAILQNHIMEVYRNKKIVKNKPIENNTTIIVDDLYDVGTKTYSSTTAVDLLGDI